MPPKHDQNLSAAAPAGDRTTIHCIYCGKPQDVSARAQSVTCKFCYKRLNLKDESIAAHSSRKTVETIGMVTVEKRGTLIANPILCGGLIVRGKVKGAVRSRGPVLVGPEGEIKGDVTAPSLAVGAGAVLEGRYTIGVDAPPEEPEPQRPIAEPD
jgi:hypothetical protein